MPLAYRNAVSFSWTANPAKSARFYVEVLGLAKVYEAQGWMEFAVPGVPNTYLALNHWTQEERAPRNEFLTLGVEDLDGFKARLEAAGVRLKGGVLHLEEQNLRMLKFYDPDGNVITVAQIAG